MTREKAIEIIEYHKILVDNDKSGLLDKDLEYEAINKAIKALEQEPRWIPVSERYPKIEDEHKYFLVTDDKGKVRIEGFYLSLDKEPRPYFSGMVDVTAWMPLPKPYREVEK